MLSNLLVLSWALIPLGGASAGQGATLSLVAALLLGLREGAAALALHVAGLLCWWALVGVGLLSRPPLETSDMGAPFTALRALFIASCVAGIVLVATSYLLRRLPRLSLEADQLIADLRAEIEAKEAESAPAQTS